MFLLAVLVTVVIVGAQEPHPCESPKQFEGRQATFDHQRKSQIFARFAYDDIEKRFREIEIEQFGKQHAFYDTLYLHNVGLEYKLDLRTRKCNVTAITSPFRPFAIPPDAKFKGAVVYGAAGIPNQHVNLNRFEGEMGELQFEMFHTSPNCIPVQVSFFKNSTRVVKHRQFYDVSVGISDPEAFIPPKDCIK
ncbi:mammalian ependymin-related protein 1-like [Gigantopelta aegis]|uniref:mammalian ependymin-related protein 1-like n=1 Tax=Gigantopelta aegis TaxID=1735272 RepID=UPI001B8888E7|nr:mammalian ependymin-related protein 1-like [Gigantopelta aegis]